MKRIAILASGSGTNAENIIKYFKNYEQIQVNVILSNKKDAYVLERAKKLHIPHLIFNKHEFYETNNIENFLLETKVDLIVLAGFLWLIPEKFIHTFQNKIINIHPALLPKYGGKGMYGAKVHEAVLKNKDKQTGITIHYVNNFYDDGQIIFQKKCDIEGINSAEKIAQKIHELEYEYFPKIIEQLLTKDE
ncbi:MAG: phosphoribosylglycinamide formyltransferase [Bacteroidetes bacterium]|nr:MAG: phosphoribosylglycinamide formyltransferase [Bacteroidota bacterium]